MSFCTRRAADPCWRFSWRSCAFAALLLLTSCGQPGGSDDPDGPDTMEPPDYPMIELTEPPREPTAWELVADRVAEDGTVSKEVALQAFALTIGDIPGVTPPAGETIGAHCGSTALRWVTRHADTLTGDERAAIEAAFSPDRGAGASADRHPAGTERGCTIDNPGVSEDGEGAEEYRPILEQELDKLEQVLGRLGIPVYITLGLGKSGSDTAAWASPQSSTDCGVPATSCRVEILVNREAVSNEAQLRALLSHELVHCFQFTWLPINEALRRPDWFMEGFADFAGAQLNPTAERGWFIVYAETPLRRLYTRTYDGLGFFFHLQTIGADVFGEHEAAFKLMNSSAVFARHIGPSGSDFATTWASSYALDSGRGDAWDMPEAPAVAMPKYNSGMVTNGRSYTANAAEATTRITHLDFEADVLCFQSGGGMNGRISWDEGGEMTLAEINGQAYCRKADGCECPGGSGTPPLPDIPSLGAIVSTTGTTVLSSVEITGISIDDYCSGDPETGQPAACGFDSCVVGTWVSDAWVLPGPISELDGNGGDGAVVMIRGSGVAQWNFDAMQPITIFDEQIDVTTELYSRGSASGRISATGGTWNVTQADTSQMEGFSIDNILGEFPLAGGPGLFVLLQDGQFTCSGSLLTYMTTDPVEDSPITITFRKQ
jgi:hypothetical protein